MEKPKKVRKELSRLESFLTREVERLDRFAARQADRKSVTGSLLQPFLPALSERRRLAAADLDQVKSALVRLEDEIVRTRKPGAEKTTTAVGKPKGRKADKSASEKAPPTPDAAEPAVSDAVPERKRVVRAQKASVDAAPAKRPAKVRKAQSQPA